MNRRWLLNALLLIVIVAMTTLAVWRPGLHKPAPKAKLTKLDPRTIQHVRIEQQNRKPIVLNEQDQTWYMESPVHGRAHVFNTARVLRIAMAPVEQELPPSASQDLAQFGLAKPKAVLKLDGQPIAFGGNNPVNNDQYVLYQKRVYLIDTRSYWDVARPYNQFLDSHLFRQDRKPLAISLPGLSLKLVKGRWMLHPANKKLTTDRINTFVDEWRYATAMTVKRYQGKPVQGKIRIRFSASKKDGKAQTVTVDILSRRGELILYRPDQGLEYHFPEEVGKRLLQLKPD
jgi:hypothetical protein